MLRLRTKFALVMTGLVIFVVAVLTYAFGAQLLEQLIQETNRRAGDLAEQVFVQAEYALVEACPAGACPTRIPMPPKEVHDYVRHAFEISEGLQTQFKAAKENRLIYEVSITDADGVVLASSDPNLPGAFLQRRASLSLLAERNFVHQMRVLLASTNRLFEHNYTFRDGGRPIGEVRVIVDTGLLVPEIRAKLRIEGIIVLVVILVSTLLAAMLSGIGLLRTAESS